MFVEVEPSRADTRVHQEDVQGNSPPEQHHEAVPGVRAVHGGHAARPQRGHGGHQPHHRPAAVRSAAVRSLASHQEVVPGVRAVHGGHAARPQRGHGGHQPHHRPAAVRSAAVRTEESRQSSREMQCCSEDSRQSSLAAFTGYIFFVCKHYLILYLSLFNTSFLFELSANK